MTKRHRVRPELVAGELSAISDISRVQMLEIWTSAHGRPPPKGISRRLLEYVAAYELQSMAFGGLKPAVRRKLRHISQADGPNNQPVGAAIRINSLAPGSRLVREWHGRTYTVDVLEEGFQCDGQKYRSLSQVAHAITGARWSGPRFFGL